MVLFAFSVEDQVEKYGAYVGIAAFFGLALLTLLYFAQAREVKRLREWAGRAPERAAELEQAVLEHAEEVRRAPTPVPAAQPQAAPQPAVAATNGAVKLKPEEVAALAFARAAGVRDPHEPKAHPAGAAALAAAGPATQVAAVEPEAEPVLNGGGNGAPPPPATPAALGRQQAPPPAPLPPRRKTPPTRRPAPAAPPPRESNTRAVVITGIVGVLVLAAAAIFAFGLPGGGGDPSPNAGGPNATAEPTQDGGGKSTPKPTATAVKKSEAQVFIYNGTGTSQLAARFQTALTGEGWAKDKTEVGSLAEDQYAQTSVVMYGPNAKRAANLVATDLGIENVVPLDDAIKSTLADKQATPSAAGKDWNVVVILGQDKSTQ
jgi:hypothetical protein